MRVPAAVLALLLVATVPAAAQSQPFCFHAKPKPACDAFILTNAGAAFVVGVPTVGGHTPLRGILDYGVMFNTSPRHAFGVSVLASLDHAGFGVGPAVRYRRWLTPRASVDVGVGFPVLTVEQEEGVRPGSILGFVRFSPETWFPLAARPELLQNRVFVGPGCCDFRTQSKGRVSFGMQLGEVPGLIATSVAAAALGVIVLLIATTGS